MKLRNIFSVLLVLCMVITLLPLSASAATVASGYCGENQYDFSVRWTLDSNGKLTISGSGVMGDYNATGIYKTAPWLEYRDNITQVVVNSGITHIGDAAFAYCTNLTSITIAKTVTSIGGWAFYKCWSLPEITIPSSVERIDDAAFYRCDALTDITLPASITTVSDSLFYQCYGLTEITFEGAIVDIGKEAFYYCESLTTVNFNSGVSGELGEYSFAYCSSLTAYEIPEGITQIGEQAFFDCTALESITIPEGVTSIYSGAFRNTAIVDITIPSTVIYLPYSPFTFCDDLESITIYTAALESARQYIVSGMESGYVHVIGDAPKTNVSVFGTPHSNFVVYYDAGTSGWVPPKWNGYNIAVWAGEGHVHDYAASVTAPTCSAQGYTEYTCTLCGDSYVSDYTDILPHTHGETKVENEIPATCTSKGSYEAVTCCAVCGLELQRETVETETLPHTYESTEVEANCTEPGGILHTCTDCGHTHIDVETEALGHTFENGHCTVCGRPERAPGDVNGDGEVDIFDANLIVACYNGTTTLDADALAAADVNGDGEVDIFDANLVVSYYNGTIAAFPVEE